MAIALRRDQRPEPPVVPTGELRLNAPPELQPHEGAGGALMMALPMLASVGSIVFVASTGGSGGRSFIAAGMFLVATLGFVVVNIDRQRKQRSAQMTSSRREYLQYLATVRKTVREAAKRQRMGLLWRHPDPTSLAALAEDGRRLWERTPDDPDHLQVRYGTSAQPLALELVPPESAPIEQLDPVCASALHRLLAVHRAQPDLPAAVDLRAFSRIELVGGEDVVRSMARALVCQAAAFHAPENVLIAVLTTPDGLDQWEWLKWLPHAASPVEVDAVGPSRMVTTHVDDLVAMLPQEVVDRPRFGAVQPVSGPQVVVVLDGVSLPPGNHVLPDEGLHGVTVIDLPERWDEFVDASRLRFELEALPAVDGVVESAMATAVRVREEPVRSTADLLDLASAEAFARRLAPMTVAEGPARDDTFATVPELTDLLGIGDVREFDVADGWRPRPARDLLRVPVGIAPNGAPVHLDIKEAAQQGMGPHGLVIGATGSGKSEFLRTLVLGLAMTHSSDTLNLVLVDFKGGATFAGLNDLPHVAAVITNLENELTLVDRMQDAISGEMVRRQELLRRAGNFQSLRDYEKARAAGADIEPLPSLFIVVDEFSELLSAKPEFIDLFVAIGRLGRSLGIHLLLASQRLEEGRLRGLESHLSYRVGLRTFSASESRTVLGVPDAYELPSVPGLGFLKADQDMTKFKSAYVSGPPPRRRETVSRDDDGGVRGILPFSLGQVLAPVAEDDDEPVAVVDTNEKSVIDIAADRMGGRGSTAHQIWLPPLDTSDPLDAFFTDLTDDEDLGLHSPSWRERGPLRVPMGILDRPREQRRDVLVADLAGAGGHVAVVGGPRSGKSTFLRTLVTSLSLVATPTESTFYVLDFGGGTFGPLANLPHVAGVATRAEPDVVRRVIAEVQGIIDKREKFFRTHTIDSVETYRTRRAAGDVDDGLGDVFLVIDGWGTLRSDFDMMEMELQTLAQRGLTFGIHVITAASRWSDFRAGMRDQFGTRYELRLGDTADSEIDRKLAQLVPTGRPGRGIVAQKLHFLAALPRIDAVSDVGSLGAGVEDLVRQVADAWGTRYAPRLRLLPTRIALETIVRRAEKLDTPKRALHLGIDERDLAPVSLDIDREPHLLLFGDSRSGKSSILRAYGREVIRNHTAKEAQLVVVDYRRSLLGEFGDEYLMQYHTNSGQAGPAIAELAEYLKTRLPGPDITPEQLRNRSWWTGAEVFLVVDDYDLVSTASDQPLAPLVPLLSQARDVGLHVVIARRSGGASRALYEPVIAAMRDLAMPGLVLSGSPDEGMLLGTAKPRKMIPGRAQFVTRDKGVEIVQTAWSAPTV